MLDPEGDLFLKLSYDEIPHKVCSMAKTDFNGQPRKACVQKRWRNPTWVTSEVMFRESASLKEQ